MLSEERRNAILQMLDERDSVSVAELVDRFTVSEMTVRRDLYELEKIGLLRRVHGGAINGRGRSFEPPLISRSATRRVEKERIGRLAASLVSTGDSIILDVGTTTLEVARHLTGQPNISIITPSFDIAGLLADQPSIRLVVTGGILRPGERSLIGSLAEQAFASFYVDKLFLGIGAIDFEAGLTEFSLEDAPVKKAMLRSAKETIVVADASKFNRIAFAAVAPLKVVDRVVTDSSLDPAIQKRLEEMGIVVLLA